jgi:hypothetical protein
VHQQFGATADLRALCAAAAVELAVQFIGGLRRDEVEWKPRGQRCAEPFQRFAPGRMTGHVVVAEARDRFRVEFDLPRRRLERLPGRIGAERGERRHRFRRFGHANESVGPELLERGRCDVARRELFLRTIVDLAQPGVFIEAFIEAGARAEALGERAEDREIVARFADRFDRALHRE